MTTVQCVACRHFSLRSAGEMAGLGAGNCAFERRVSFVGALCERQCDRFARGSRETEQRRRQWLVAKQETFNRSIEGA
ncbi:MAG: hypothetical protein J0I30_00730 [Burkholderiales bacterium]|nr:hypothetical protein [Burkholderiales bacterium]